MWCNHAGASVWPWLLHCLPQTTCCHWCGLFQVSNIYDHTTMLWLYNVAHYFPLVRWIWYCEFSCHMILWVGYVQWWYMSYHTDKMHCGKVISQCRETWYPTPQPFTLTLDWLRGHEWLRIMLHLHKAYDAVHLKVNRCCHFRDKVNDYFTKWHRNIGI